MTPTKWQRKKDKGQLCESYKFTFVRNSTAFCFFPPICCCKLPHDTIPFCGVASGTNATCLNNLQTQAGNLKQQELQLHYALITVTERGVGKRNILYTWTCPLGNPSVMSALWKNRSKVALGRRQVCLCPQKHIALTREFHIPAKQTAAGNLEPWIASLRIAALLRDPTGNS